MLILVGITIGIGLSVLAYNTKAREKVKAQAQQVADEFKKAKDKL